MLLLENRLSKTIKEYFLNNYFLAQRQKVQVVTMDLNVQYQQFVHYLFPNAIIVFACFHLVQLASRALDQARIKAFKEISDPSHKSYLQSFKETLEAVSRVLESVFRGQIQFWPE
ncbi:transposase [Ligilactobacillus acidipiscis]|uniref:transposase n=2 Tax=Ligilactobacillus acidipiscis TaxID=89059 RepID=UPI000A26A5C8